MHSLWKPARRGSRQGLHSLHSLAPVAQYSIDVIIAWALIGEWSSRVFIGEHYAQRAPSLTAWARACFEQGALASLLYLPGIVPIFTLPGDRMFQSTGIHTNVQRRRESPHGICPPDTATARLDTDGFCAGGN